MLLRFCATVVATPMQPEQDIAAMGMLDAEDVAHAVVFAVTRPQHVHVSEIRINPSGFG
jgi:NADP-dependent 3-hydroxy acid dehydrogenase YdfG